MTKTVVEKNMIPEFFAMDPSDGARLRAATVDEIVAYLNQPVRHPSFRAALRVGAVLVDEWTGYGIPGDNNLCS